MKLVLVIVEGQFYLAAILAIFAAELGFLFWGLWSRRPIIGLIAVFVTVPLIRSTVSSIRARVFRIRAPEGMPLGRSDGRALYDFVEEIRRAVDAPPVHRIAITGGFHASGAVDSPPWRFRRRRTLQRDQSGTRGSKVRMARQPSQNPCTSRAAIDYPLVSGAQ